MFRRSVVLVDRLAPDRGAFPHALELAHRLRVPVHGVASSAWSNPEKALHPTCHDPTVPRPVAGEADEPSASSACARACARASVRWEWSRLSGHPLAFLRQAVAPDDLLVFDQALPTADKRGLLRQAMGASVPAVLVCRSTWSPLMRILLVDQGRSSAKSFLRDGAALCRRLGVETIVLTVDRSERLARRRQDTVRSTLAGHGLNASFDSLVGVPVRDAVACVARWRHCQLVVLEREERPRWWQWLRRRDTDWVINAAEFVSFLFLPDAALADPASLVPEALPVRGSARPGTNLMT